MRDDFFCVAYNCATLYTAAADDDGRLRMTFFAHLSWLINYLCIDGFDPLKIKTAMYQKHVYNVFVFEVEWKYQNYL